MNDIKQLSSIQASALAGVTGGMSDHTKGCLMTLGGAAGFTGAIGGVASTQTTTSHWPKKVSKGVGLGAALGLVASSPFIISNCF